jgi:hypothetical protein
VVNAADFYEFVGSEMFAAGADLYVNCMDYVADQIGDIGDKIKVFFNGKSLAYSVDSDLQQAVYAALMQYTAEQNGGHYFKPYYSSNPASYGSGIWGCWVKSEKYNKCVTESPMWWKYQYNSNRGYYVDPYIGSNTKDTNCAWYQPDGSIKLYSTVGYITEIDYSSCVGWGPAVIAYDNYDAYVSAVSASSSAYVNTEWSPSGALYVTNDGLNYDWAARNSLNYSTLVNAITDGTIDGQTMINTTLVDMSSDLDDIRETINQVSDDVSESTDILQNIYDLLKKYLPLLEDIKDSPSKILDGTSDSSVLSSIKRSVSQILALMYADQLTDLLDEYFGDDDDKESYTEKSIGYVLLVLMIFVYMMKIFIHLLAFIVAFFNIEPALCSDFLPDEMYQGFLYLDEIMIPYLNMSVWDFEQLILYTVMIFYCIRLFVRHADRFKFE